MVKATELLNKSLHEKKEIIESERSRVNAPNNIHTDLHSAYQYSQVLNIFIKDYIQHKISADQKQGSVLEKEKLSAAIDMAIKLFYPKAAAELKKALPSENELVKKGKNLYEIAGARKLAFGNNATRTLSTTMGNLWETLADISPFAINPEQEFGIKIKGIDAIFLDQEDNNIYYAQLKTQKNTLTGSQSGRSVSELLLHEHPVFCACFETKTSWTFNNKEIPKLLGREFWGKIGINYDILVSKIADMILTLEGEYVRILNDN